MTNGFDERTRAYVEELFGVADRQAATGSIEDLPDDYSPVGLIASESDFDLSKLVDNALDPVTGAPRDIKIPENDFPEAKNYFDFCLNFQGPDFRFPFIRQMWIMLMLFGEVCPRCTPTKWMNIHNVPVGKAEGINQGISVGNKMQLLDYGTCPRCKVTKRELFANRELKQYRELALCVGQRGGKSTTVASGAQYMLHKYLKYPRMSSLCVGIQASTPLMATFVGYRFADAFNLLWDPIIKNIDQSPWFTDYHAMLDFYGKKHGIEFYRKKDVYLRYGHKNLELYPAGPSKRALRGRTRWLTAIDELGWFPVNEGAVKKGMTPEDSERERADADEVWKALDRSLLTMRGEVSKLYDKGYNNFLQAYALNISSPSSQFDKITRLVNENENSRRTLALRLATWQITPMFPRDHEEIVDAYEKDAVGAERDYGANPPQNDAAFIDIQVAERCFTGLNRASVQFETKIVKDNMRRAGYVNATNPAQPCPPCVMSIDAGLSNNSFAITVLHLDQLRKKQLDGEHVTTRVKVPVMLEIQPRPGAKLHYTRIYEAVLSPLIKAFNVQYLFADRWNSVALLDRAADEHPQLQSQQYSVRYEDFVLTRSYIEESRIEFPKLEMPTDKIKRVEGKYPDYFEDSPAAHLLFQLMTVRDKGKTVLKGPGYTDDIFRALVLGLGRLMYPKIYDDMVEKAARMTRGYTLGAFSAGRSGLGAVYSSQQASGVAVVNGYSSGPMRTNTGATNGQGNSVVVIGTRGPC
jgi:hypothetical protein